MAVTRAPLGPDEDGEEHQSQQPQQQQPQAQQAHPSHALHQHSLSNASTATLDIEAWTAHALESLSIIPIARGTGSALSIPLDADHDARGTPGSTGEAAPAAPAQMKLRSVTFGDATGASVTPPRRPPSRRDSMRRRDQLLRGNEGSRQRRRWENAHLVHVPNVQPPLPTDWQIQPTHRVLPTVPYQLAQYWDKGLRSQQQKRAAASSEQQQPAGAGHVPRDLRTAAKRVPAVKSFVRVLEEPVRQFVVERGLATVQEGRQSGGESSDETDPDDEEIVFVGRNGRMRDGKPWKAAQRRVAGGQAQDKDTGLVLDAMDDDDAGGAFKRWLTHSISDYYGLDSKSAMVGSPARRVIYVGVKPKQLGPRHKPPSRPVLPPPLWEMF